MTHHPISTPVSPSNASSIFDASFDSIESLPTTFVSSVVPVLETTTVTEVTFGDPRNGQYSITAMTTSSGAVADRNAYTAYGQPTIANAIGTVLTSSAASNRYTYTDCEWDETLGLHHFLARWMSTLAERLVVRELIGYEGNKWDLYEIIGSGPLSRDVSSGLSWAIWPFNSINCNTPGKDVEIWSDSTACQDLKSGPASCTSWLNDYRDFVYFDGKQYKDPGEQRYLMVHPNGVGCFQCNCDGNTIFCDPKTNCWYEPPPESDWYPDPPPPDIYSGSK